VKTSERPWTERLCNYSEFALLKTAPALDAIYYANYSMAQLRKLAEQQGTAGESRIVKIENNIISISVKDGYSIHIDNSRDVLRDTAQARGIFTPHMFQLLDVLLVQLEENLQANPSSHEVCISMDDYLRLRGEPTSEGSRYKYQCRLIKESLEALAAISIDYDGSSNRTNKTNTPTFSGLKILMSDTVSSVRNHRIQVEFTKDFVAYIQARTTKMPYYGFMLQLDIQSELTYAFARKLCQHYCNRWNQVVGNYNRLSIGSLVAVCPTIEDIDGATKEAAIERRRKVYYKVTKALDYLGRSQYIASNIFSGSNVADFTKSLEWSYQKFRKLMIHFFLCNCGKYKVRPPKKRKGKKQGGKDCLLSS